MNDYELKKLEIKINNRTSLRNVLASVLVIDISGTISLFYTGGGALNVILFIAGLLLFYFFLAAFILNIKELNKLLKMLEDN